MAIAALIIAGVSLALFLLFERLRRPKLDIVASIFQPSGPFPWTFAAVLVHNRPLPRWCRWLAARSIAQGCAIQVTFEKWGQGARAIPDVPARWSANPQPIRASIIPYGGYTTTFGTSVSVAGPSHSGSTVVAPATSAGPTGPTGPQGPGAARLAYVYEPELDPQRRDIAVSPDGEHAAVAMLYPDAAEPTAGAYAFGTESYQYLAWRKPEWKLGRGTYLVRVTVTGSSVQCQRSFKLEYLSDDFAKFVLTPA